MTLLTFSLSGTTPVSNEQLNRIFRGTLRSDFKHIISLIGILYGPVALFGFRLPIICSISAGFVGLLDSAGNYLTVDYLNWTGSYKMTY